MRLKITSEYNNRREFTQVVDAETGEAIEGVQNVKIEFDVQNRATAIIETIAFDTDIDLDIDKMSVCGTDNESVHVNLDAGEPKDIEALQAHFDPPKSSPKIRLWTLGDMDRGIFPTTETIDRLRDTLAELSESKSDIVDLIWGGDLKVYNIDGGDTKDVVLMKDLAIEFLTGQGYTVEERKNV